MDFLPKQNTLNCILKKTHLVKRNGKYFKYLSRKSKSIECFAIFLSGYDSFLVNKEFYDIAPSWAVPNQYRREMLIYNHIVISKKYFLSNWEIIYKGILDYFKSRFNTCINKIEFVYNYAKDKYLMENEEFYKKLDSCSIDLKGNLKNEN